MPDDPMSEQKEDLSPHEDAETPPRQNSGTGSHADAPTRRYSDTPTRHRRAFVSKLSDAEAEAAETQVHIEIAYRHGYLNQEVFDELDDAYDKILCQIVKMIDQADRWLVKGQGGVT